MFKIGHYVALVAVFGVGLAAVLGKATAETSQQVVIPKVMTIKIGHGMGRAYRFRDEETGAVCYAYVDSISCTNDLNSAVAETSSETDGYIVAN